jgi:subtilisin-like proprotein convertase family protein
MNSTMKLAALSLFLAAGTAASFGQSTTFYQTCDPISFNCGALPIPDNNANGAVLQLYVPDDPSGNIMMSVEPRIWINHTFQGDLRVVLISPNGTSVELVNRPGLPACGPFGFGADDLGGFFQDSFSGFTLFKAMRFTDAATCGASSAAPYDVPGTACPGYQFGGTPTAFNSSCLYHYNAKSPLAAFAGESKQGIWQLLVQDLAQDDTGSIRYLGLNITARPISTPIVSIASPASFQTVCDLTTITGTVNANGGEITSYKLEYASDAQGPWTTFATGTGAVAAGTLGSWNTVATGASEGYKLVRLTATNDLGISSSFGSVMYVDRTAPSIFIRSPLNNSIVGGSVCPNGAISDQTLVNYRIDYAPGPSFSNYNPIDPSMPVYTTPPSWDRMGTWNTLSGGAAVADGTYRIRYQGTDTCGRTTTLTHDLTVDNTPPVALITSPTACQRLCGAVAIAGTASDLHLSSWVLQYTGGDAHNWVTIGSGVGNVNGGTLATWNTSPLRPCAYVLRLVVSDTSQTACGTSSNVAEYYTGVNLGAYANCDQSTGTPLLTANDFQCFINAYAAGCP